MQQVVFEFRGQVNGPSVNKLIAFIHTSITNGATSIVTVFRSGGGYLAPAIDAYHHIVDDLNGIKGLTLTAINDFGVGSSANLLYLAYKERLMLPNAEFLIHSTHLKGQVQLSEVLKLEAAKENENQAKLITQRTIMKQEEVLILLTNGEENKLNSSEAAAYKFGQIIPTMAPYTISHSIISESM